jgi:hypothetical protein
MLLARVGEIVQLHIGPDEFFMTLLLYEYDLPEDAQMRGFSVSEKELSGAATQKRNFYLNALSLIPLTIIPDHEGQVHMSVQRF